MRNHGYTPNNSADPAPFAVRLLIKCSRKRMISQPSTLVALKRSNGGTVLRPVLRSVSERGRPGEGGKPGEGGSNRAAQNILKIFRGTAPFAVPPVIFWKAKCLRPTQKQSLKSIILLTRITRRNASVWRRQSSSDGNDRRRNTTMQIIPMISQYPVSSIQYPATSNQYPSINQPLIMNPTKSPSPAQIAANKAKSLSENSKGCCGRGYWLWARRRERSIPKAGCDDRANAAHSQKTRRPEGFRAKSRLTSCLAIQPFAHTQHPSEFSDRLYHAQKSTGPKTAAGRNASKMNAVKHGIFSTEVLVRDKHLQENPGNGSGAKEGNQDLQNEKTNPNPNPSPII